MGLEDLVQRLISGGKGLNSQPAPSPLDEAMAAELQRLDLYKPGLGRLAIGYVATGDGPAVLDAVAACAKAVPIPDFQAKGEAECATSRALVTGRIEAGPAVGRFMRVRLAAEAYRPQHHGRATPTTNLPTMALFAAIRTGVLASQVNYSTPWASLITLRQLFELVQCCDGTEADLFAFLLASYSAHYITEGSWTASSDFAELARIYPAAFAEAIRGVDYRLGAVKLAEHHGCQSQPEVVATLMAMLTRPFGKDDREIAISALARLDGELLFALLELELAGADIDRRFGLVQAAGRNGSAMLIALLRDRDKVEKAAKVKAAIQAALGASQPMAEGGGEEAHGEAGYSAIDGSFVAIPPALELAKVDAPPASDEDRIAFMACVDEIDAQRAEMLARQVPGKNDRSRFCQPLTHDEIEATFSLMTQGVLLPGNITFVLVLALRHHEAGRAWYDSILQRLPLPVALNSLLGNGHGEIGTLIGTQSYIGPESRFAFDRLHGWLEEGKFGLRELLAAEHRVKADRCAARGEADPPFDPVGHLRVALTSVGYAAPRQNYQSPLKELPSAAVWPWLAENLQIIGEALGLEPAAKPMLLDRGLAMLELLPAVPQRYLAKLLEVSVTENRQLRRRAMALLRDARDLEKRIEALLDDPRQQVRVNAATWLADIRAAGSEVALRKRLKKEKSDPVRTALIEALQRLGADLSDIIGPASLIAEAEKAARNGAPDLPAWLVAAGVPAVHFRDGSRVPEVVLRHLLALAIRLKDPGATRQFGIYLDQLATADAQALSAWVLESWISYDTHSAPLEEANAHAVANFARDYRWLRHPQTPELRERIIAELRRRKLGELLNSGTDTKGVLALACRADPVWAANRVRWFLKNHGRRSHQAMALLDVLAGIGAPATLQVVIAASARLKQKSTQAHAAEIAERYAEDRGWSVDDLADRTVPTAGFDDDGVLELPCGEDGKLYVARLDAALAIHLFNPEGKAVKCLPAGEDEASRESRKGLSTAKKELKQVIDLQATRLFEAMCVERSWPVADWRVAFHEHPVMRRLAERLVWQGLDAEGQPLGLFRPTQEGDFTDAADIQVAIDRFAQVRLAHGALVDAPTCQAWVAHLKDYEIVRFIAQFDALRAPLSAAQADAESITDRVGWVADSLTYRGIVEKRGYERVMGDGGGCSEYAKSFPSHGITATIHHSGSSAVDENNKVALKELGFRKAGHRGRFCLKDVPPVMLAECWADYHMLAAKGIFDPEWEKISAW